MNFNVIEKSVRGMDIHPEKLRLRFQFSVGFNSKAYFRYNDRAQARYRWIPMAYTQQKKHGLRLAILSRL